VRGLVDADRLIPSYCHFGISKQIVVRLAPSVVSCGNITTIPARALGGRIGGLLDRQDPNLGDAIRAAFDLD
jgi:hypothetical protein